MTDPVRRHYEQYPYPCYPLLASVRACDGYAINLTALWARFNGELPPPAANRILVAGCGSFAPYPFSVANPDSEITALDLSGKSIGRARLHCLLHGRRNVRFQVGDLLEHTVAEGLFGLIDAYGVIHHLEAPLSGLRSLAGRLAPGGIMRVMLYSRYARREEESIRRSFRMMGIGTPAEVRRIVKRSAEDSRLRRYFHSSSEVSFEAGLADALLHPRVHTFRIDDVLEMIQQSGLRLLRFAHHGALDDVGDEAERIRLMERDGFSPGNFLFYLGRSSTGGCRDLEAAKLVVNPCLTGVVSGMHLRPVQVPPRLGFDNPILGWRERRFLRAFRKPVAFSTLTAENRITVHRYLKSLFLIAYRGA
jgi:SAM-dependent methyltransferase